MLTSEQQAAVDSQATRIAIVAGAGTGKTTTLVARVQRLLEQGVPGDRILVTTFTVAAAQEVRHRLAEQCGHVPETRTVHSLCADLVRSDPEAVGRLNGFSIYDQVDSLATLRDAAHDLGIPKARKAKLDKLMEKASVRQLYEERLRESNALDYEGLEKMGALAASLWPDTSRRYDHVLIDEAQDLSEPQWAILQSLNAPNICLIGDPRQCIYQWRGARPKILSDAINDAECDVHYLTKNWRSGTPIVGLANRIHPRWRALTAGRGVSAVVAERVWVNESEGVARTVQTLLDKDHSPESIVVLARTWRSLWGVRKALREAAIPNVLTNASSDAWESEAGRAVARWISCAANPHDANMAALVCHAVRPDYDTAEARAEATRQRIPLLQLLQAECLPAFPDTKNTAELVEPLIRQLHPDQQRVAEKHLLPRMVTGWRSTVPAFLAWWRHGRTNGDKLSGVSGAVALSTIHGAKGLEWDTVILCGAHDGQLPGKREIAEERNLLYVAATRARDRLLVCHEKDFQARDGRVWPNKRSRLMPALGAP